MSKLLSIWLIFMSLIWVWHALPRGNAAKTRGLSSAMELEADLHRWATENASEEAVSEIFDEGRRLLLGGEHPTWSFREMIEHIATDAVPPEWPGIAGLVIGVAGLVQAFTSTGKLSQNKSCEVNGDDVSS